LFWKATGYAVGDPQGNLAGPFLDRLSLDHVGLPQVGKTEIPVEFRGGPDIARFDASVVRRGMLDVFGGSFPRS